MSAAEDSSRWCTVCESWKPVDEFRAERQVRRVPDWHAGVHHRCRDCVTAAQREWREKNPERLEVYRASRRAGPFDAVCSVCTKPFLAARRPTFQSRCPDCQELHRKRR